MCAGNLNSSDGTVWKQEWRALTSPTNASPDPRRQTLIDLKTFTIRRQQKQQSIILFIDANDHLPNSQRFRQDTDLIDIIAHERTDAPSATHMDGNRIDYILLSHDLTAGTIASGILPINHHVISDHRASYCDINVETLFSVKILMNSHTAHGANYKCLNQPL